MRKLPHLRKIWDFLIIAMPALWIIVPFFPDTIGLRLISLVFAIPLLWGVFSIYYYPKDTFNYYISAISLLAVYKSFMPYGWVFSAIFVLYASIVLIASMSVYVSLVIVWFLVNIYILVFFPSLSMFVYMIVSTGGFVFLRWFISFVQRENYEDEDDYAVVQSGRRLSEIVNNNDLLLKEKFDVNKILDILFELIRKSVKVRSIALFVTEKGLKNDHLRLLKTLSNEYTVNSGMIIKEGDGVAGWVLHEKEMYLNNNYVSSWENLKIYQNEVKIGSVCAIPIRSTDKVGIMGILVCDSEDENFFDYEKVDMIEKWATIISLNMSASIAFETLHTETMQVKRVSELLRRLTSNMKMNDVVNEIGSVIGEMFVYDFFFIGYKHSSYIKVLYSEGINFTNEEDKEISLNSESFVHFIVSSGNAVIKDSIASAGISMPIIKKTLKMDKIESIIGVPLKDKFTTRGVIIVGSKSKNEYTKEDLEWLELIGNISVSAMMKAKMYEKIEDKSLRDGLTGVYNRNYFDTAIKTELSLSSQTGYRVGLLMIDIDHFKKFNDEYGHLTGDEVLKHVSNLIEEEVFDRGFVARYGGEEFAVVLTRIDMPDEVLKFAENLREKIERERISFMGNILSITVSIGVGIYPDDADNVEKLISVADTNLYKAKESGRNKVIYHRRDA